MTPTCVAGKCVAETNLCSCASSGDCAKFSDKCTTLVCATFGKGKRCQPAGATKKCPDDGNPCTLQYCDGGACKTKNQSDLTPCDDGKVCTSEDRCDGAGQCVGGTSSCGCLADKDCEGLASDKCLGVPICDTKTGQCGFKPNSAPVCKSDAKNPDGKVCRVYGCRPSTGKCGYIDTGKCQDGLICTADACDVVKDACKHTPIVGGTPCGPDWQCKGGTCVASPAKGMTLVAFGKHAHGCNDKDPDQKPCAKQESPLKIVELSAYWMDRAEVTRNAYEACVKAGKCTKAGTASGCVANFKNEEAGKLAINCVSAKQAQAYCAWAVKDGKLPTGAQYERAARGHCGTWSDSDCGANALKHVWGSAAATCQQAVLAKGSGSLHVDCGAPQIPGSKPNDVGPYGHYDLAGNLSEWTRDGHTSAGYQSLPTKNPHIKPGSVISVRGGSFKSGPDQARVSWRGSEKSGTQRADLGFRCAVVAK